jgi:hypothetical protein
MQWALCILLSEERHSACSWEEEVCCIKCSSVNQMSFYSKCLWRNEAAYIIKCSCLNLQRLILPLTKCIMTRPYDNLLTGSWSDSVNKLSFIEKLRLLLLLALTVLLYLYLLRLPHKCHRVREIYILFHQKLCASLHDISVNKVYDISWSSARLSWSISSNHVEEVWLKKTLFEIRLWRKK